MTAGDAPIAAALSGFVRRQLKAHPQWQAELAAGGKAAKGADLTLALDALRGEGWQDEAHLKRGLRQLRNRTLCALIEADLSGQVDLAAVMASMSLLADRCIAEALSWLQTQLARRHGVPLGQASGSPQDLIVVAMGKLGAGELNVSSDVDLIFLFGEAGETDASGEQRGLSNDEFFTRVAKRLINVLADVTEDGFVFRVDMRLRPNGDAGPLVASLAMLEEYLMVQGRSWERFAWIKARVIACPVFRHDARASEALDSLVRPFVFRRYLDFSAISALRELHAQIRAEAERRSAQYPGRAANVKLGRGGIREIEFIAQSFQLIRGGRDAELRARATLDVLDLLASRGLLRASIVRQLKRTYCFLREIEHRLQYRDDLQTHVVPADPAELAVLVRMCQALADAPADARALLERLEREQAFVAGQFDALFRTQVREPLPALPNLWAAMTFQEQSRDQAITALKQAGFADVEGAFARLHALWHSPRITSLNVAAKERLERLVPAALSLAVARAREGCDATQLLARFFELIEAIAGRASYLALLYEYPEALARVADVLAASPWAARFLTQHPILLDELLQGGEELEPLVAVAAALDRALLNARGDVERQMDVLRESFHARSFALLVEDLAARVTVESLADHLSALCDLIIARTLDCVWQLLAPEALERPNFAVIAYGKLGGKELGYASDLDLVFLTGVSASSESLVRYGRLAQRLVSWLTARTAAGGLFDIDVRLRPDGVAGLNVASFEAFVKYQRDAAWVWEHQALTRARFCAGDASLGAAFEVTRREILCRSRDLSSLRAEISAMRKRMHEGHPNLSTEFDLKHDPGGMVDIEFVVQFLVLGFAREHAPLADNVGNIELLSRAARFGLIPDALAAAVATAYRDYRRAQHRLRLAEARFARVPTTEFAAERRSVSDLYRLVLE